MSKCVLALIFALFSFFVFSAQPNKVRPEYLPPVINFKKDKDGFFINKNAPFYLRYMWQSFVALSWPNVPGYRDRPDRKRHLPGSASPLVWETYPQPQEVFLLADKWANYPDWETIPSLPVGMTVSQIEKLCRDFSVNKDLVLYDINQPNTSIKSGPVAPLIDQYGRYVRYQVTMNRTYFDYVASNQYYNAEVQEKAVRASQQAKFRGDQKAPVGAFEPLPFDQGNTPGIIETKAAWRVLDPDFDDPSRYYVRSAYVLSPDKTQCEKAPVGAGLVALHIHRLTRLSHVASTFEQVDNVDILDPDMAGNIQPSFNPGTGYLTQQNIWPPYGNRGFQGNLPPVIDARDTLPPRTRRQANNISRATEIPPAVRRINREFQQKYKHSLLRYYQMINVQHVRSDCAMKPTGNFSQPVDWNLPACPQPNTNRLINAALESYTQLVNPFTNEAHNYSCRGCHMQARPCGFKGELKNAFTFKPEFMVMSYLLSKARFPEQLHNVEGYSCNSSATQNYPLDSDYHRAK